MCSPALRVTLMRWQGFSAALRLKQIVLQISPSISSTVRVMIRISGSRELTWQIRYQISLWRQVKIRTYFFIPEVHHGHSEEPLLERIPCDGLTIKEFRYTTKCLEKKIPLQSGHQNEFIPPLSIIMDNFCVTEILERRHPSGPISFRSDWKYQIVKNVALAFSTNCNTLIKYFQEVSNWSSRNWKAST